MLQSSDSIATPHQLQAPLEHHRGEDSAVVIEALVQCFKRRDKSPYAMLLRDYSGDSWFTGLAAFYRPGFCSLACDVVVGDSNHAILPHGLLSETAPAITLLSRAGFGLDTDTTVKNSKDFILRNIDAWKKQLNEIAKDESRWKTDEIYDFVRSIACKCQNLLILNHIATKHWEMAFSISDNTVVKIAIFK